MGGDVLSQERAAFPKDGDVEGGREPVHDGAQPFKCFGPVACFGAEPGEVASGAQFEQARSLLA
jgi:hypothetical protein